MDESSYVVHPRQVAEFRAQKHLIDLAGESVRQLLGEDAPQTSELMKKRSGICHICGRTAKMTFEHLPPRSVGNHLPARMVDLPTALAMPLGQPPRNNWLSLQRGTGLYVLYVTCKSCNETAGDLFVNGYLDFAARTLGPFLKAVERDGAKRKKLPGVRMVLQDIAVGAIIRQVIYMLLAVSGSFGVSNKYPQFRQILEGECLDLPQEVHIRMGLVVKSRIRFSPLAAEYELANGKQRAVAEIAHLPFAWMLQIGDRSDSKQTVEATSWTRYGLGDVARTLKVELPIGTVATPFGGDYRYPDEVE